MKKLSGIAGVLIVLAAPLVAIASAAPALAADPSQPQVVAVVTTEYKFSPATLTFRRGALYRLHLENHGKEMHEFHAPEFFKAVELGDPAVLNADRSEIAVHPDEAKDLNFFPKKAGHYKLYCPDHDWAGMAGTIIIK